MTIKQSHNSILKRKEIEYTIEAPSNPGFQKASELVAEKLKASPDTIVLKAVRGNFGTNTFLIEAFVYDSAQDKERIEPKRKSRKKLRGLRNE